MLRCLAVDLKHPGESLQFAPGEDLTAATCLGMLLADSCYAQPEQTRNHTVG